MTGNPENLEQARNVLWTIRELLAAGWKVSGLWESAHCGIPGNELADSLAKQGAQATLYCAHTRTTRCWLQEKALQQQTLDWAAKHPPEKRFPQAIRHFP